MEREMGSSEEQDRERPLVTRGQNLLAILPPDEGALAELLEPVAERFDPSLSGVQAVVITPESETAAAVARAAQTSRGSIRAIAVTSPSRAERLLRGASPMLVAGTPSALLDLVRKSVLKLESVRAVVLAWADSILDAGEDGALEALLAELPKDSARIVATSRVTPAVEQLVERYARRPRRTGGELAAHAAPRDIRYVAITERSRPDALRRLLDDLDPERVAVYVRDERSEREVRDALRGVGHADGDEAVQVTRGTAVPNATLIVLYDFPPSRDVIDALGSAETIAFVRPRQLGALRMLAAGGGVRPYTLSGPAARARRGEEVVRDELRAALADAPPARELLTLEPLLDEFDGVELAAAALRLLEQERRRRPPTPSPAVTAATPPARAGVTSSHVTVFINAGARDGVAARDLVGAISGESGITSDKIGRIDVRDNHSLVEIASDVAERVVERMTGVNIKGRRVVARVDRERSERTEGDRERPRGRPRAGERDRGERDRGERDRGERDRGERGGERSRDRGTRERGPRDRGPRDRDRGPRDRGPRQARDTRDSRDARGPRNPRGPRDS
ncbi:MAG TPA: DbpA RNA binding domain-containing protein [Gemmatimonadaceae bacterium]|nr:DbpA RNA binding domain-containing protein [Gemmatimonadaceae bacterium]